MLTFQTRKINRSLWKVLWRQYRIVCRETSKAVTDAMIFGTGFVRLGADVPDFIAHVDPHAVRFSPEGKPEVADA